MDLASSCKEKIARFRLKELKEVLTQLGLSKQGKKQDLVDRILSSLSDEQAPKISMKKNAIRKNEVAKIVDDAYRKLQPSEAAELASKGQCTTDCSNVEITEECDNSICSDTRVRCPCGSTLETDSMIRCEDPGCKTWQHIGCVLIPQQVTEGKLPVHDTFYCELCRLSRADPFFVSVSHPLYPRKMKTVNVPTDGTSPTQTVEETFQLTSADKQLLSEKDYDIQAWCMLLNDLVPFRMQWPQYADLQVNGIPVRVINRPGSQLLGANGRDNGSIITPCIRDGRNIIYLSGFEARIFCFGVRIVKRRTLQEIFTLIPKESDGEHIEDALARVRRCIGGGGTTEADSDSDLEVVADFFAVNLRCPMSGSRIKTAGRFKPCVHIGCFDLEVFVQMNERSRKWQCPICLQNYSLQSIVIDPYFNCITSMMRNCEEEITDIEVKQDGSWRVKAKSQIERSRLGDLAKWHSSDGALYALVEEVNQDMEASNQIKQDTTLGGGLKLGNKNNNGYWETDEQKNSVGVIEVPCISFSSSGTGSSYSEENPSMKVDCADSHQRVERNPSLDAELIILSDSDDENDILVSTTPIPQGDPNDIIKSGWSVPTEPQTSSGYQFLVSGNDSSVPKEETTSLFPDGTVGGNSEAEMDYGLIDIPFANDREDPSLQIFLPTMPSEDPREEVNMSNEMQKSDDWFSFHLGDGPSESTSVPTTAGQEPLPEGEITEDTLADNDSFVDLNMDGCNGSKVVASVETSSEDPFTFTRQKRSVRQRLCNPGNMDED